MLSGCWRTMLLFIISAFFGLILIAATILKETPVFWRNEGGYPVFLRELLLDYYFPLLFLNFVWTILISTRLFHQKAVHQKIALCPTCSLLILMSWAIPLFNLGLLGANNCANLIEGRPLHSHAGNQATTPTGHQDGIIRINQFRQVAYRGPIVSLSNPSRIE